MSDRRYQEDCYIVKLIVKGLFLVDYTVISHNLFPIVKMFVVGDVSPILSNIHSRVICTLAQAYNVKCNHVNSENEDDPIDDRVCKFVPIKPTWKSETECMFKHELSHKHQIIK